VKISVAYSLVESPGDLMKGDIADVLE